MTTAGTAFQSMTLRFWADSLMPVPAGKWRRLATGEIEVTYTPQEWEQAKVLYDGVIVPAQMGSRPPLSTTRGHGGR